MNKGGSMQRQKAVYTLVSLCICCLLFFSGCGLDEYYIVNAPYSIVHGSYYNTTDYTEKYFDFWTNDAANYAADSSFDYLGTAVYYKIYNNYSTMTSAASAITALNSSTTYSAAADKMIESYGYRELVTTATSQSPLIPASASNQRVYIRLSDYQSDISFAAKLVIGYSGDISVAATTGIPRRNVSGKYTFNFGRTTKDSTYSKVPANGDSDYSYTSSGFSTDYDNTYFVDMFAVAVGRDTTYTKYYSQVLHLGAVAISSASEDN
jgi:hypothetical protein